MIVKIQNRGHSFKGLAAYLLNPKRDDPESAERVAWSETGNMYTNDIEQAAKVMAWTDENADQLKANAGVSNTGAKRTLGGVYHYSLAWAHGEKPDQEHQRQAALETIKKHGLEDHEFFMVAHDDTEHSHIHIVVNLTNAEDGTRHKLGLNKRAMSDWALEYEQQHGIHCEMRITNRIEAQQLGHNIKHQEQKQDYAPEVTAAYNQSDNGQAFLAALNESGLTLAQGRKRLVLVDGHGEIHALARQVDGANTKQIKAKLSDVNLESLADADALRREILERLQQEKEREETEREREKERDLEHDELHQTTGDIAQDYIDLAHDPLQDVRGWLDEIGQGGGQPEQGNNILLTGQAGSPALVGELQQVREPSTGHPEEGRAQGNSEQENSDSRQGTKRENERIEKGDIVKALDRDNFGTVQAVDGEEIRVMFTNKETKKSAEKVFKADALKLHIKAPNEEAAEAHQKALEAKAEERERIANSIQRQVDERTAASFEKHDIENLRERQREAQNRLNELSGFWSRYVFKREQYNSAAHDVWAIGETLRVQEERFRDDIKGINSHRPEWARKAELAKYGFDDEGRTGETESEGQKADVKNEALREAQSSPEAAERLADQVQAKTPKQAVQVAEVRQKAETRKAEKEAEQKQNIDERAAKQEQQQKPRYTAAQVADYLRQQKEQEQAQTIKPEFEQATQEEAPEQDNQAPEYAEQLDYLESRFDALGDDMSEEAQSERVRLAERMAEIEEQERLRLEQEQMRGYDIEH